MGDLAYCMIASLNNEKANNRVFLIGGPEALTYRQIADIYEKLLERKVRVLSIPAGFQKFVGFMVDTFTGYRYDIQGFIDAFSSGDSTCDNTPLHEVFDIKLRTFEDYLSVFLSENQN
jgi:nucleoside-diphosphate-sugar epimerase